LQKTLTNTHVKEVTFRNWKKHTQTHISNTHQTQKFSSYQECFTEFGKRKKELIKEVTLSNTLLKHIYQLKEIQVLFIPTIKKEKEKNFSYSRIAPDLQQQRSKILLLH
jgi:hypothetical protein